jgi:hypothetical protein
VLCAVELGVSLCGIVVLLSIFGFLVSLSLYVDASQIFLLGLLFCSFFLDYSSFTLFWVWRGYVGEMFLYLIFMYF